MTDPLMLLMLVSGLLIVWRLFVELVHWRRERHARRMREEMRRAAGFSEWWGRR